jgi:ribosomal protein L16 Arg81 hydroxylase
MKIDITMETTPAELREFLGLPEVQSLQAEMIEKFREQMQAGVEGFDPLSMMRPFIAPNLQSMEAMQRAFWDGLSSMASSTGERKREG